MNRITIATLATLILGATQAEYTIRIPMEQYNVTFYDWVAASPIAGEWEDAGAIYDCSNWSPLPTTIAVGQAFTQTATDCKQDQVRTVQDREAEKNSGSIRNSGEPYTESRTITVSDTRDAIGSLETWIDTTPVYTVWVNSGSIYGCSNWTPESNIYEAGESINQTATDCKQDQTRSRQDREQETTTLTIRNKGTAVIETQTLTASSTRATTGTLTLPVNCRFSRIKTPWSNTIHLAFKLTSSADFNFVWGGTMWATAGETESIFAGNKYIVGQFVATEGGRDLYAICKETP